MERKVIYEQKIRLIVSSNGEKIIPYFERFGNEQLALKSEISEKSEFELIPTTFSDQYYIKSSYNSKYIAIKYTEKINSEDLNDFDVRKEFPEIEYELYLCLLDNGKYTFKLIKNNKEIFYLTAMTNKKSIRETNEIYYASVTLAEKATEYSKFQISYDGYKKYLEKDLAINYSIAHKAIKPNSMYSNYLVEPILTDNNYNFAKDFGFDGDEETLKYLLGEFYATLSYGIGDYGILKKPKVVGFSHYSRCLNLNYYLPPINLIDNKNKLDAPEIFCLCHGLTTKNFLFLLGKDFLKSDDNGDKDKIKDEDKIKKYKFIIPNPDYQGEKIVIKGDSNNYTLKSQYINHPHALWDEFDKTLEAVLNKNSWKYADLGNDFVEVYKEYREKKNAKLYFKCQVIMHYDIFITYARLLVEFFRAFHEEYFESKVKKIMKNKNKFEGGRRLYAYMGERIYSFFCYYLKEKYEDECYEVPISCYKDEITDRTKVISKMKNNYKEYKKAGLMNNEEILFFYKDCKILRSCKFKSEFGREVTVSFAKDKNFAIDRKNYGEGIVEADHFALMTNDGKIHQMTLTYGNWEAKGEDAYKLISNKDIPEIVGWEDYPNLYSSDENALFVKTYCPITLKNIKNKINKRISIMAEALTENDEKIYIILDGRTVEYHKVEFDEIISKDTKIKVFDDKNNKIECKKIGIYSEPCKFAVEGLKGQLLDEICLINWDYIPVYLKIAHSDF